MTNKLKIDISSWRIEIMYFIMKPSAYEKYVKIAIESDIDRENKEKHNENNCQIARINNAYQMLSK